MNTWFCGGHKGMSGFRNSQNARTMEKIISVQAPAKGKRTVSPRAIHLHVQRVIIFLWARELTRPRKTFVFSKEHAPADPSY